MEFFQWFSRLSFPHTGFQANLQQCPFCLSVVGHRIDPAQGWSAKAQTTCAPQCVPSGPHPAQVRKYDNTTKRPFFELLSLLTAPAACCRRQVSHIRHHDARPPTQTPATPVQTWHQQAPFGHIGWRHPTDQRHQGHRRLRGRQPQAQRVLLVADKPAALARLERASTQCGMGGRVKPGTFF